MNPAVLMLIAVNTVTSPPVSVHSEPGDDPLERVDGSDEAATLSTEVQPPGPWFWFRQQVAVAGWPAGLISDTRVQVRGPMYRSSSIVFQETYAGAGARLAVTPAFVEVGPLLSLAPIDIFDVNFRAGFIVYWPSSSGLLPYDDIGESTRDLDREERFDDPDTTAYTSTAFEVSAAPTLKLKVGPVIAFSGWTLSYYWIKQPEQVDSPLVYEPFTDRRLEWNDMVVDHQSAIVGEFLDGDHKPLLWIGGTFHDVMTLHSDDRSMSAGGLIVLQPSYKKGWPQFIAQVTPYIMDPDRAGGVPRIAVAIVWTRDISLRGAVETAP